MTDKEALEAHARGEKLPQTIVMHLWREGLIEIVEATHLGSIEREYLPSFITVRGQKILEAQK
jgi:hypothetical protein